MRIKLNSAQKLNWRLLQIIFLIFVSFLETLTAQEFIPLWEKGKMPNSKGIELQDSIANERIFRVGTPGVWAFFPSSQENKHAAVIICPGGGYQRETYILSGTQIARYFNTIGINAFVLKYRLPNSIDLVRREIAPLQDLQRAIKIVRANAAAWGIDKNKIGVWGASAGGHLASTAGTHLEDISSTGDSLKGISPAPDFLILISPVIDMGKYTHAGSRDNLLGLNASQELIDGFSNQFLVTAKTPPSFIVHAVNDPAVPIQNSLLFYNALIEKGVNASLHTFPFGGHNIALRNNPGSTELWTVLCEAWLKEMKFIGTN